MWCLIEAVSGQTFISVFCIQHIIQVYRLESLRLSRMYHLFFQSLNVIDIIIIIFIHSWLVSMVTEFIKMKEKVICYYTIYGCYGLFCILKFYDFFNQYCLNLLKNPTVRGFNNNCTIQIHVGSYLTVSRIDS